MHRLFTLKFCYFCILLMFNFETGLLGVPQPVFMSHLQKLCPFSTYCHNDNATLELPDENVTPCCDSCSCEPDCYLDDTCCYDNLIPPTWNVLKKCLSSVVSNTVQEPTSIFYNMIVSCSDDGENQELDGGAVTLCEYNQSDYTSFAPVTSQQTGDIYVNSQCAHCNNVYDLIHWKLSVSRPNFKDDHSFDTVRLLQGNDIGPNACYLTYVPADHVELDKKMCKENVIRQCNVTGLAKTWEPFWDFCPMFNATYAGHMHTFYGNVFCFLCNQREEERMVAETCAPTGSKNPYGVSLTIVLDTFQHVFEETIVEQVYDHGECGKNEVLIQDTCRRVHCPWGQFRVARKCGFYSLKWIGGPFTSVLKLTPRGNSKPLDKSTLLNLPTDVRNDMKGPWLQRNAMKHWYIETLYKPSDDGLHVDYLVAFAHYPRSTVNPERLLSILQRTLDETWTLSTDNHTLSLDVKLNPYSRYNKRTRDDFRSHHNITIDEDYAYITVGTRPAMNKDDVLYAVHSSEIGQPTFQNEFLKESFLCDQIEILFEEYDLIPGFRIFIKATNQTLTESKFWFNEDGNAVICLNNMYFKNKGFTIGHRLKYWLLMPVIFSWVMKYTSI